MSNLPPEIWDAVLYQVEPEDCQAVALSLQSAIPSAQISTAHLFRHVYLRQSRQIKALFLRFSRNEDGADMKAAIRTLTLLDWRPDENLFANMLSGVCNLERLHLNIGPRWTPDSVSTNSDIFMFS